MRWPRHLRVVLLVLSGVVLLGVTAAIVLSPSQRDAPRRAPEPAAVASPSISASPTPPPPPESRPELTEPPAPRAVRPGPETTGPVDETVLQPVDESVRATEPGEILEELDIDGSIAVKADDVVIRNVRLRYDGDGFGIRLESGVTGVTIENSEIEIGCKANAAIFGGSQVQVRDTEIRGCGDGVKIAPDSVYEGNWIHMSKPDGDDKHLDGMQNDGGSSNVVIRGNFIDMPISEGGNYAVYHSTRKGPVDNVVTEDNWLNGGNHTVYYMEDVTNGAVIGNRFGRDYRYDILRINSDDTLVEDNLWAFSGQQIAGTDTDRFAAE